MENKDNNNQEPEIIFGEDENEEMKDNKSPFLLVYALIIFLAILVAVGLWIVKSFGDSEQVSTSPNSSESSIQTSASDTSSESSTSEPSSLTSDKDKEKEEVKDPATEDPSTKEGLSSDSEVIKLTKLDKERLTSEQYEGVFLKMHNLSSFSEDDFEYFRGMHIICTEGMVYSTDDILEALDLIFGNSRTMPEMYMEIEPYDLWMSAGEDDNKRDAQFERILRYIDTHPETTFEFAYSFPSVKFWNQLSEEDFSKRQEVYYHVTNLLKARSNVYLYSLGNFEWLIANPTNYDKEFIPNEATLLKLMLTMFCDRSYQFKLEDVMSWFALVKNISDCDKLGMYSAKLPEGKRLVLLSDSVCDFYRDSYGIESVLSYITGAKVYNLSKGGLSIASDDDDSQYALAYLNEGICSRKLPKLYKDTDFAVSFNEFVKETKTDDKLTFVVILGINDFLNGNVSIKKGDKTSNKTTYSALLTQIKKLKKAYPNSEVVVVVPYTLDMDPDQPSATAVYGTGEKQANYMEAISKAAKKLGCDTLNLFEEGLFNQSNMNDMIKSDCIHPSETGEFEIAKSISKFLLTREK